MICNNPKIFFLAFLFLIELSPDFEHIADCILALLESLEVRVVDRLVLPEVDHFLGQNVAENHSKHDNKCYSGKLLLAARKIVGEPHHAGEHHHSGHFDAAPVLNLIVEFEHLPNEQHGRQDAHGDAANEASVEIPRPSQAERKHYFDPPEVAICEVVLRAQESIGHIQQVADSDDRDVEPEVNHAHCRQQRVAYVERLQRVNEERH
jgi:hypothetical protein